MASTPQSQARSHLRDVAREGAHYISSLPVYEDGPYASLESAAYHYEHRDGLYMEEYIRVDAAWHTATLAVRWVADDDDALAYQPPEAPDSLAAGYGDVTLPETDGVAARYRWQVVAGVRAALALAAAHDGLSRDPAAITPVA